MHFGGAFLAGNSSCIKATCQSQARHALEHGKRVFLIRPLVLREPWAREYVEKRGAIAIESVDEILAELVSMSRASQARQLTLG